MCLVYLDLYDQTVTIKERFYLASFIQLETQADNIGVRSGVRPQLHRPRRRVRMSVVSAPTALLARRTAAPRAGVRAARSTSVVRCDASKGAESNNPRASLGRRDVFGAVAAGVALLSSSQPASALQPGDIGYLKAQREAAANAPPAPEPEPEPAAAPAPAKKTAKAKPAPKPKAPPKPKPTPKAKAAPAPKAAPTPPPPRRRPPRPRHPRPRHHPRPRREPNHPSNSPASASTSSQVSSPQLYSSPPRPTKSTPRTCQRRRRPRNRRDPAHPTPKPTRLRLRDGSTNGTLRAATCPRIRPRRRRNG